MKYSADRFRAPIVSSGKTSCGRWLTIAGLALGLALPALAQSVFENPKDIHYDGDEIQILASKQKVTWQGLSVESNVYSAHYKIDYPASYTPPTIRMDSGKTLRINLISNIDYTNATYCDDPHHQYTNLHYHGFEVSPKKPQDDVVNIKLPDKDGTKSFRYAVVVPPGHPEGMFWYHPHPHGCSYFQVNSGMSGILIVGDILHRQYPELDGIKERILLLKDGDPRPKGAVEQANRVLEFAAHPKQPEPDPISVNGMSQPVIPIATGEKQFFRVGNVGADFFVKLAFDPPVNATIVAVDGMATDKGLKLPAEGWLMSPGSRVEMIVEGPAPGTYKLMSKEIPGAMSPGETVLATLEAKPNNMLKAKAVVPMAKLQAPRARAAYYPQNEEFAKPAATEGCDVHSKPPDDPRYKGCTFVFSSEGSEFRINGKMYDEHKVDVTCKIDKNKVYDWTLCNDTDEYHAFHIHQIHFDVVDIDGHPPLAPIRDVVELPGRPDEQHVSQTHIKMSFQHDYLEGEFVFHCHMLFHEDHGMMMNIELVK